MESRIVPVTLHERPINATHWSTRTLAEHPSGMQQVIPARLNREFGKRFGDKAYAFEELVAETHSAFQCAKLGIADHARADHAQYVRHWLDILRSDSKAIFTAA